MCGKFTTMASWTEIVDFIHTTPPAEQQGNDKPLSFRVMDKLPVIVRDAEERCVMAMRWGFPDPANWQRPRPIHARAETIDTTNVFAAAFRDGQRGIVLMKTFNEAPDVKGPTVQHIITPDGAIAVAFVWRRFEIGPEPLLACVMVTVPANPLIAGLPTDRMPAVLAPEDWAKWLGEEPATPAELKACLKTVDGLCWTMTKEERGAKTPRARPTVSDPAGLF